MSIAIIGLAAAGNTTIFNALTRGNIDKGIYGAVKSIKIGAGAKPDARLDFLQNVFQSRRKVRAEMTFWDMPVDYSTGAVLPREVVNSLQKAKALVTVVRKFEDPATPHPDGSVDWVRDLEKLTFEILFADIALIDRRVERVESGMKALKQSERVQAVASIDALKEVQSLLEDGSPLRSLTLDETAKRAISDSFALSDLPLVVAVNVGEEDIGADADELRSEAIDALGPNVIDDDTRIVPICGSIEEELRSLGDEEANSLRADFGIESDDSEVLMDACLKCLKTQTFYTASDKEARAWHFPAGASAPEAAGVVHSDMERGFIRAEVVAYDDFVRCGSMLEARKQGVLRQEGRNYTFADGDLANFLFSV
jgi:GTP-binding protein YchF